MNAEQKKKTITKFKSPINLIVAFLFQYKTRLLMLAFLWLAATGLATIQPLVMAPMVQVALRQASVLTPVDSEVAPPTIANVNLNNIDQFVNQLLDLDVMQPWDVVLLLSGLFLAAVILGAIFETIAFYVFTWVRVNSLRNIEEFVFRHLLSLSLDYFNKQRSGAIVSRLQLDIAASVNHLTNILKSAVTAPVMALVYGVMLVRTNFELMLLVSLIAIFQWTAARILRNRIRKYVLAEFDFIAMVNAYLNEIFQNIRVVKSFVAERFEWLRLRESFERMIPVHINRALSRHLQEPIVIMINGIGNVLILLLSTRELFNGNLTVVGFFLFLYVGRAMVQPITQVGQIYLGIQEMTASATRVFENLQVQSSIIDGDKVLDEFHSSIRFESVSFAYGDEVVLNEVSVEIAHGQTVALVGPSGAGKSTFTDLLLRFYDPSKGNILIDGVNVRDVQVDSYRRLFGVVAQENLLFNDTVARNIAYGREGISHEQISSAAEVAHAAEFIEAMPSGYETLVGDRGIRLSGGQRQRIAIARAIVHQPEILILDEATSSLDTESERMVQAAIDHAVRGRTAVVIAHRLSTVVHADKIIVMQAGRVIDEGKHLELFERCKLYRHLVELQFQINQPNGIPTTEPAGDRVVS